MDKEYLEEYNKDKPGYAEVHDTSMTQEKAIERFRKGKLTNDIKPFLRTFVSEYFLKGYSARAITRVMKEKIGRSLDRQTITKYVKQNLQEWAEQNMANITEAKAQQLMKIDKLESTYWEAWDESKEENRENTVETESFPSQAEEGEMKVQKQRDKVRTQKTHGDASLLKGIEWCIEMRCKIMGIGSDKIDITTQGNPLNKNIDLSSLDTETLKKIKEAQKTANTVKRNNTRIKQWSAS